MIRNVVFDVGRVLIDFSFKPFFAFLRAHRVEIADETQFLREVEQEALEHGSITSDRFVENVLSHAGLDIDRSLIRHAYCDCFSPMEETLDLLEALAPAYKVFLLSNTSELHWTYLDELYRLERRVHGAVTSYRAGAMKPSPGIYRELLERYGLVPKETVFIDDIEANVEGARSLGMKGICFTDVNSLKAALAKLGVRAGG